MAILQISHIGVEAYQVNDALYTNHFSKDSSLERPRGRQRARLALGPNQKGMPIGYEMIFWCLMNFIMTGSETKYFQFVPGSMASIEGLVRPQIQHRSII